MLCFKQHSRWYLTEGDPESYRHFGPDGHQLNFLIYIIAAMIAPIIGIISSRFFFLQMLALIIVIFIAPLWQFIIILTRMRSTII
jgi:hypothetical protein